MVEASPTKRRRTWRQRVLQHQMVMGGVGVAAWKALFLSAITARETTPVNIVCIGDSITEEYPPSGTPSNLPYLSGWQCLLADSLRTRYPTSGVTGTKGYFAARRGGAEANYPQNWPITRTNGVRADASGLAIRNMFLNGAGAKLDFVVPPSTSAVDIFWRGTAATTSFNWRINGGSNTAVSTTLGSDTDFRSTRITGISGGDTLTVEYVSGAGVFIDGFYAYAGDETKGIRIWDAGKASVTAQALDSSSPEVWFKAFNVIQPVLVLIALGGNDWGTRTPAQLKANLLSIYDKIDAQITGNFGCLFMAQWQVGAGGGTAWNQYRTIIRECASERSNCGFADMRGAIAKGDTNVDTVGGLLGDSAHPSISGSVAVANWMLNLIG